jgi:transposase
MKMNLIEVKEAFAQEGSYSKVSDNLYVKEVKVDNRRYIVCFNPEEAAHEKEKRANIIAHLKEVTNVKNFIPNRDIKKLIKLESNRITINEEKVKELEKYDGIWVLLTNTALPKEEVADRYKELWKIEDNFETMKTFLKIRPIYHYRERRIEAHIALIFLALYSERVLENLLGNGWNFRRIYSAAQFLKLVKLKADSKQYLMRTELKEETKLLIRSLGMQFPKRLIKL